MEQWKPVPGFEKHYEVSTEGRIRRVFRKTRLLKPVRQKLGYKRVDLYVDGASHLLTLHRLIAEAFIGQIPPGYQVNHKNGDRGDNRLENLEIVTPKENQAHSWRELQRRPAHRGETTPFAKLTEQDVIRIRRMRDEGMSYSAIAKHFNTKPANIWHIATGRTWKHLLPTT